ncbi:MAG: gliding motility-associated C-terminal domain-containing protein [Bacteroidota bacterium]
MNSVKNILFIILCWLFSLTHSFGLGVEKIVGDTVPCLIELELSRQSNGNLVVSIIPDTTWDFPNNVVSTAQITLKVPTGQFTTDNLTNLVDGVIFFEAGRIPQPAEAPNFDYISYSLGSTTSNIPFVKGQKTDLFTLQNGVACTSGTISLMSNFTDPFIPPNQSEANVGQQFTVSGFGIADIPIGVRGDGVDCSEIDTLGVQIVQQDITCTGARDGLIIAKANGGFPDYQYHWNTGDTLSTIENLTIGNYMLTVTDASGDSVTATVVITEPEQLFLVIDIQNVTNESMPNGSATPRIVGGTPPYRFSWSNGMTDSLQMNLAAGDYSLTVTDANGCMVTQSITIMEMDCPEINLMLDMTSPSCPGDSTGALRVLPSNGQAPYTYLWGTGDTTAALMNIPTGNYMVSVTDANGCMMAVSALLPDAVPIAIALTVNEGTGMDDASISSTITGGMMPYTYAWSTGSNDNSISGLGSGVYDLTITDANGCEQMASAVIEAAGCDLGILDEMGTSVTLDSITCGEMGEFCLPVPLDSMENYSLFLNGDSYMEQLTGCRFDTFYAYTYFTLPGRGDFGPYILDEWTVNNVVFSGQFSTIEALVDSMNLWDVGGTWVLDTDILIFEGGLPANRYGEMTIRTPLTSSTTTLDVNTNLTPTGTQVSFEAGTHELILVRKETTCSDTLTINQPCRQEDTMAVEMDMPLDTTIVVEVLVGGIDTLDLVAIFGDSLLVTTNECPEKMDGNATITNQNDSLLITGLMLGTDSACYTIRTIVNRDTSTVNLTVQVNVVEDPIQMDCLSFVDLDTFAIQVADCQNYQICVPLIYDSLLTYAITDNGNPFSGIVSACDNDNGSLLNFSSPQTHELIFTNSNNCRDTSIIAIHAPACDEDLIFRDTIEVNENGQTCIVFSGLPTPIATITDLCPDKNGEMAMLTIDETTACVNYTGVELGVDTACLEVCDVFGFCDTVSLIVIVTSGDLIMFDFMANPDTATTNLNRLVVFNALGNDVFTTLSDMYLVTFPDNGVANFNLDGTISYQPVTDYCNDTIPDTFQYAICDDMTCDTTTATIFVECRSDRELVIYTGISPNGDGVNDTFVIEGIENYPNNSIQIFNRWGNMIFRQQGYKNEWNGTWDNESSLLPDGTYFYLFDTGEGEVLSGFVEVRR